MAMALRQRNMRRSLICPICQKIFRQVTTIEECCHRFCQKCIKNKIIDEGLHNCPVCNVDLGSSPLQSLSVDYHWQRILDEFNETQSDNIRFLKEKSCHVSRQEMKQKTRDIANVSSNLCRELRPRRREEGNTSMAGYRGSRNPVEDFEDFERVETFWFSLVASDKQKCKAPLEQIPAKYLRVKDGNITVSSIKKYIMQKLNLRSENEVEITLEGRLLVPSLQIRKLVDLWLRTTAPLEKKKAFVGSSAGDFVLTLTYARRPIHA